MEEKEAFCLKRFGFLPRVKVPCKKQNKVGRQASERHYLKDEAGIYLTTRELEISLFISKGCTVREAANKLKISPRTAEFYLANVRRKLGVSNKQQLLRVLFDNDFFKNLL